MEEKDSEMSGPHEEFRICFCGKSPSGSVEWYLIDVSDEEACLSEKTESSTRKLTRFSHISSSGGGISEAEHMSSFSKHLSSCAALGGGISEAGHPLSFSEHLSSCAALGGYISEVEHLSSCAALGGYISEVEHLSSCAALGGLIYSLGGQRRSPGGGDTLLKDVWLLDFKSLEDLKLVPGRKPELQKSPTVLSHDEAQARKLSSELHRPVFLCQFYGFDPLWVACAGLAKREWKPGLPMNFARYKPHTMVVDHKLYVLGGFKPNQNQADGWIEVFDPEVRKWESLPSPPDQIHSSIMISGLLKSKKEIIIARQRRDCHPLLFYSYNIMTRCWNTLVPPESEASVHLPPNAGRAVTVGNTLYWISTEEDNDECTIRAYDLDRNMWFEGHLNTATIFGSREEYFSSIYSRGPGFLHLVDQKFCLLLQSSVTEDPQPSIEYLYCVILNISPIYEHKHKERGKFELTTVSVEKYTMDHYIDFLDCMLLDRVSGVKSVDRRGQSTSTNIIF